MLRQEPETRKVKVALYHSEDTPAHSPYERVDIDVPEHIIDVIDVIMYAEKRYETGNCQKFAVWIPWHSASYIYIRRLNQIHSLTF